MSDSDVAPGVPSTTPLYKELEAKDPGCARQRRMEARRGDPRRAHAVGALRRSRSARCARRSTSSARANLLIRQQGRGTFVASHNRDRLLFYFFHVVAGVGREGVSGGAPARVRQGKADRHEADALRIAAGDAVLRIRNLLAPVGQAGHRRRPDAARRALRRPDRAAVPRPAVDDLQPVPGAVRRVGRQDARAPARDARRCRQRVAAGRRARRAAAVDPPHGATRTTTTRSNCDARSSTPRATSTGPTSARLPDPACTRSRRSHRDGAVRQHRARSHCRRPAGWRRLSCQNLRARIVVFVEAAARQTTTAPPPGSRTDSMRSSPLYSSSRRRSAAATPEAPPPAAGESPPAAQPPAPAATAPQPRSARYERPLLVLLGTALALGAMLIHGQVQKPARALTQDDIDAAVLHTLENKPLPSRATRAYEMIKDSVVRVRGLAPTTTNGDEAESGRRHRRGHRRQGHHPHQPARRRRRASASRSIFSDGLESEATVIGVAARERPRGAAGARRIPDDLVAATLRSTGDLRPATRSSPSAFRSASARRRRPASSPA